MEDTRAIEIINMFNREYDKSANFRSLYQQTADLMFVRENQITSIGTPGADKSRNLYDDTAEMDSQDMASGLSSLIFPIGQKAFDLKTKKKELMELDHIRRYLSYATDITHDELFDSNFMLQLNETLRSLVVFGTSNLYSEWDRKKRGLNFKDWDVSYYVFLVNSNGIVDTMLLKFEYTARQAVQEFENPGEKVAEAYNEERTREKVFEFIHVVRPRQTNPRLSLTYNMNMPFESIFVNISEKLIIEEGGFPEFPFACARWMCSSTEKWGRGQGTRIKSTVKTLQQMWRDYIECGNKHNNPPREILDHFEGRPDVTPGACNYVQEKGTIRALEQQMLGNFPVTKEMLEFTQSIVHRAFYTDIFAPLKELTGDRRNEMEIRQRIKEAMGKLGQPYYRLQSELLNPLITRCVLLLIRNGKIPYPPPELQGQGFGLEYTGELALALRNQKSRAFQQWVYGVGELESVFPGVKDNVSEDRGIRRMARALGVDEGDISTEEEVEEKREARAEAQAKIEAAQMAQTAADAYGKTTKAPESGSPAELINA